MNWLRAAAPEETSKVPNTVFKKTRKWKIAGRMCRQTEAESYRDGDQKIDVRFGQGPERGRSTNERSPGFVETPALAEPGSSIP